MPEESMQYMKQLLAEVEAFDPSLFPPQLAVGEGEDVLGNCPEDYRKVYSLARFCDQETKQMKLEEEFYGPPRSESECSENHQYAELSSKHKLLMIMFWNGLNEHFHLWADKRVLGVRADWKVVAYEPPDGHEIVKFMMGKLNLD